MKRKHNPATAAKLAENMRKLFAPSVPRATKREKKRPRTALISEAAQRAIEEREE